VLAQTSRTAVYGPVRTVVWEGSAGDRRPYPDQYILCAAAHKRYAQANLETKRKAIEQVDGTVRPAKPPRWQRDRDLLAWLDSL